MKKVKLFLLFFVITTIYTSCSSDNTNEITKPLASNIEIGTANNKQALIGRDFHFNADVTAGNKIADVQLKILPKKGETYSKDWKLELYWAEYKGTKNTNVHKHFSIPADAPAGKYDFWFIVLDENGSQLEIKEELNIIDPANMPADPLIGRDMISRNDDLIYYMETWVEPELIFKKNDKLTAHAQISQIAGDGILYSVLIKKSLNYHPESIDNLDLKKVIVITKAEHKGLAPASKISTLQKINDVWGGESIVIGAEKDSEGNETTADKSWQSGQYNWVILYKNTTHNLSVYKSMPITISY
ncbi:DUF4625 domain-containing protein [Flavobacterium hercynium]|uniref:DUF4625 domain-containing protein n=1 Tax=Flavobacterium hercynium TaxID=387094 RepID=A0A226GX60_9FLAO|nr:DUF4625 domain-containing protein [Flavobacterium hercynium]OXA86031.1 hypothetical protein B0A66_18370 [Flavobacterium hercynium]SMP15651.1 protein of unknown function [Flavobacterium hercynium]